MSVSTPNVWELRADLDRIRTSARAWHALGDAVRMAHSVVESEARALLGTGWTGHAADTYHEHRDRMARDGVDVTDAATQVGKALDRIADLLETADGDLSDSLRDITTRLAHEQVRVDKVGNDLVFQTVLPRHDEAVMAEVSYAHQIRSRLDEVLAAELRRIQAQQPIIENVGNHWQPATAADGATAPGEAVAGPAGRKRTNIHIFPRGDRRVGRGPVFIRDVNACLDTFDSPGGDPSGIMPTINDPANTIVIHESPFDDLSFVYWNFLDRDPHWVAVNQEWDANRIASNGVDCAVLYHELYHAHDVIQQTFDYRECDSTGIPIAEVKAQFAANAFLRAKPPELTIDDNGEVRPPQSEYYGSDRLPQSVDDCYPSGGKLGGGGGAGNDGSGGEEGAGGGGAGGSG